MDVDDKEDLCHVSYEAERVSTEQMLAAIRGTGFEGVIKAADSGEKK